jgi:shikimate dehydrogenase
VQVALAGVLGFPVAHSRSPDMHNAAFGALGLDWHYVKLPVPPVLFTETVRALPGSGFRGANVTIPHKHAALELADERTPSAEAIGAANTLTFLDGGGIEAHNTDAPGFIAALGEDARGLRALVLGAGGAGRAVAWALREAGAAEVAVWNRTPERAAALARDLGVTHATRHPTPCTRHPRERHLGWARATAGRSGDAEGIAARRARSAADRGGPRVWGGPHAAARMGRARRLGHG